MKMLRYVCDTCCSVWWGFPESQFAGLCMSCNLQGRPVKKYRGKDK